MAEATALAEPEAKFGFSHAFPENPRQPNGTRNSPRMWSPRRAVPVAPLPSATSASQPVFRPYSGSGISPRSAFEQHREKYPYAFDTEQPNPTEYQQRELPSINSSADLPYNAELPRSQSAALPSRGDTLSWPGDSPSDAQVNLPEVRSSVSAQGKRSQPIEQHHPFVYQSSDAGQQQQLLPLPVLWPATVSDSQILQLEQWINDRSLWSRSFEQGEVGPDFGDHDPGTPSFLGPIVCVRGKDALLLQKQNRDFQLKAKSEPGLLSSASEPILGKAFVGEALKARARNCIRPPAPMARPKERTIWDEVDSLRKVPLPFDRRPGTTPVRSRDGRTREEQERAKRSATGASPSGASFPMLHASAREVERRVSKLKAAEPERAALLEDALHAALTATKTLSVRRLIASYTAQGGAPPFGEASEEIPPASPGGMVAPPAEEKLADQHSRAFKAKAATSPKRKVERQSLGLSRWGGSPASGNDANVHMYPQEDKPRQEGVARGSSSLRVEGGGKQRGKSKGKKKKGKEEKRSESLSSEAAAAAALRAEEGSQGSEEDGEPLSDEEGELGLVGTKFYDEIKLQSRLNAKMGERAVERSQDDYKSMYEKAKSQARKAGSYQTRGWRIQDEDEYSDNDGEDEMSFDQLMALRNKRKEELGLESTSMRSDAARGEEGEHGASSMDVRSLRQHHLNRGALDLRDTLQTSSFRSDGSVRSTSSKGSVFEAVPREPSLQERLAAREQQLGRSIGTMLGNSNQAALSRQNADWKTAGDSETAAHLKDKFISTQKLFARNKVEKKLEAKKRAAMPLRARMVADMKAKMEEDGVRAEADREVLQSLQTGKEVDILSMLRSDLSLSDIFMQKLTDADKMDNMITKANPTRRRSVLGMRDKPLKAGLTLEEGSADHEDEESSSPLPAMAEVEEEEEDKSEADEQPAETPPEKQKPDAGAIALRRLLLRNNSRQRSHGENTDGESASSAGDDDDDEVPAPAPRKRIVRTGPPRSKLSYYQHKLDQSPTMELDDLLPAEGEATKLGEELAASIEPPEPETKPGDRKFRISTIDHKVFSTTKQKTNTAFAFSNLAKKVKQTAAMTTAAKQFKNAKEQGKKKKKKKKKAKGADEKKKKARKAQKAETDLDKLPIPDLSAYHRRDSDGSGSELSSDSAAEVAKEAQKSQWSDEEEDDVDLDADEVARIQTALKQRKSIVHAVMDKGVKLSMTEEELKHAPLHRQGNLDMELGDALAERAMLRKDPDIIVAIEQWWLELDFGHESAFDPTTGPQGYVTKAQYFHLCRSIAKALNPDAYVETDVYVTAEKDWEYDSCGQKALDWPKFFNCVFQLVDLYTETTSKVDYLEFLQRTLKNMLLIWKSVERMPLLGSRARRGTPAPRKQ